MSFREMYPLVARAVHSALEVGDVVYGSLSIALFAGFQYCSGENISSIDQFARSKCVRINDLCSNAIPLWTKPGMQCLANLQSTSLNWKDLTILSGDIMDEEEYLKDVSAKNQKILMMSVWAIKPYWHYASGTLSSLEACMKKSEATLAFIESVILVRMCTLMAP
jgi:hypothetical protein